MCDTCPWVLLAVQFLQHTQLCQPLSAQLGLGPCAGPSPWAAGVQIPPTGMSKHFSLFSSGDGMGSTMLRKQQPKNPGEGVGCDLLQLRMFPVELAVK